MPVRQTNEPQSHDAAPPQDRPDNPVRLGQDEVTPQRLAKTAAGGVDDRAAESHDLEGSQPTSEDADHTSEDRGESKWNIKQEGDVDDTCGCG